MTTIAFLGLGHMGGPMAPTLVRAGHSVVGHDPVPAALEAAKAGGVRSAPSALELVGVDARAGLLAGEISRAFADGGGAGKDFSAIIDTIRERSTAVPA